jgi:hypothetical protein
MLRPKERLGHSSITITMDIYSHLMPNMQGEVALAVDAMMRAAINKRRTSVSNALAKFASVLSGWVLTD